MSILSKYAIYGKFECGAFLPFDAPIYASLGPNLVYETGGEFYRCVQCDGRLRAWNVTSEVANSCGTAAEMAMLFQVERDQDAVQRDASVYAQVS